MDTGNTSPWKKESIGAISIIFETRNLPHDMPE